MKKEHISDALNMLNDDIIEETNNVRTNAKPKRRWERQIAAVACICLIVVGVFAWRNFSNHSDSSTEITMSDKGVTIPKLEVSLSAESSADMLGFFIYQATTSSEFCLTKAYPPTSSIRCTPTSTEKV